MSAALGGAPVAVLDSFRGNGWPMDRFPPAARDDLLGWIAREGGWEKMSKDVAAVRLLFWGTGELCAFS